jgi:hypothetical protein
MSRPVRYTARDVKSIAPLDEAGIRGGIHSENTFLVHMLDGSVWFHKVGVREERDELFAYELAQMMFGGIVPEVRLVDLGKGVGSMMRRVENGVQAANVDGIHGWAHGGDAFLHDMANMVILDFLAGNTDRHEGNWFVVADGHIRAIDNGFTGKMPAIPMLRCLRPAKFAGIYRDPDLWPRMLLQMAEVARAAQGRGREVRELADRVGLHGEEAAALVELWEAKLAGLRKEIARHLATVTRA